MAAKHSLLEVSSRALNGVRKGSLRLVAWKPLPSNPERFFIVLRYRELYNEFPTGKEVISSYHTYSYHAYIGIQSRPMKKDTYRGMVPNKRTERFRSWERFFTSLIANTMAMERKIQGDNPEIESLESSILSQVIPRLLRPIETNGTIVKAVLLHGNL
jgi:protein-ribulosamine 3-kinase